MTTPDLMYNKLFSKILDSSIWLEDNETRIVWVTLLAVMDEDGYAQFASVRNLARRANISQKSAAKAVGILESPDGESSDPEFGGRRIERVSGGWMVLNATKYRELVTRAIAREQTRLRVQKHRRNALVTEANAQVTPSEAVSEASTRSGSETHAQSAARPLISGEASPLGWAKLHGQHVLGFCDWVCFPESVFSEFVRRVVGAGAAEGEAVTQVKAWAVSVRQAWAGRIPGDDIFEFWRHEWKKTHGSNKPAAGAVDVTAGLRDA